MLHKIRTQHESVTFKNRTMEISNLKTVAKVKSVSLRGEGEGRPVSISSWVTTRRAFLGYKGGGLIVNPMI